MWRPDLRKTFGKKFLLVTLCGLICQPTPAAAQGQTRIRLATLVQKGTSYCNALEEMGAKWRKAPGGGVALTLYCGGSMGSEVETVKRMRVGQIQAAMLSVAGLSEIDPAVSALQKMPMMFRSLEEAEYVRSRLQSELERRLLEKGFVVLTWGDAGWVRFFSKRPAIRPQDFKKMKVFVTAGDNEQVEIMKGLGFQPVVLEWSDALTALQTGMVDAVPDVPFHALASQFHTAVHHMLELDWVPLVGATVVTKNAWDSLPPPTRDALFTAAREAGQKIQARGREEAIESVEAMKKRGLQVHPVPAEAKADWYQIAEQVYPRIRGKMVPADMFDEVCRFLADYRASHSGGRS